jgi:hypothetical protein
MTDLRFFRGSVIACLLGGACWAALIRMVTP